MEKFNSALFLLINAHARPTPDMMAVAMFFAEYAVWIGPLTLFAMWIFGSRAARGLAVGASLTALLGLAINVAFSLFLYHPRPFAVGLGQVYLPHVPNSSFPSDHATFIWSIAAGLCVGRATRSAGIALALLGVVIGWARIYLGVHYPLDIAGGACVAIFSAWFVARAVGARLTALVATLLEYVHATLPRSVRR